MLPEFVALISSIKTIGDLSSSLQQIKTDDAVRDKAALLNSAIIDVQNSVMTIQVQNQELLRAKADLERQIEEMARWDAEVEFYELVTLAEGVYVYKRVISDSPSELGFPLCVHCFGNRKKSILQRGKQTTIGTFYHCSSCQTEIVDHSSRLIIKQPIGSSRGSW